MLGSDEGAFSVRFAPEQRRKGPTGLQENSLVELLDDGGLLINTGDQWGPFEVSLTWIGRDGVEARLIDEFEEHVELDLDLGRGGIVVSDLQGSPPDLRLPDAEGLVRMRISASGRHGVLSERTTDEDGPRERYRIDVWPTRAARGASIQVTEQHSTAAASGRAPGAEYEVAGQAAAARIGTAIDAFTTIGRPPGGFGDIAAEVVVSGDPQAVYADHISSELWSMDIGIFDWNGKDWLDEVPENGQGITGRLGLIVQDFRREDSRRVVTREWRWHRAWGYYDFRELWTTPTTFEFRFEPAPSEASEATLIRIGISRAPASWLDDLVAYWRWKLAVLADAIEGGGPA